MKNSQTKGFASIILIALVVVLAGALGYVTLVKKSAPVEQQFTATVATSTTAQIDVIAGWKTYTDPDNRFSLNYPSTLIINSEKSVRNQVDTVRFQLPSTSTVIQIGIFNTNSRWPDLKSLVNDQYLVSKGGDIPAPVFKTLPSGIILQDVGKQVFGYTFVGQLNKSQFIVLSFKDESLIEQVLAPLKLLTSSKTADWKTYTNSKHGFQISYPKEVEVSIRETNDGQLIVGIEKINSEVQSKYRNSKRIGITVFPLKKFPANPAVPGVEQKIIFINGVRLSTLGWGYSEASPIGEMWYADISYRTENGEDGYNLFAQLSGDTTDFSTQEFNKDPGLIADRALLEKIISTFKLTPKASVAVPVPTPLPSVQGGQ